MCAANALLSHNTRLPRPSLAHHSAGCAVLCPCRQMLGCCPSSPAQPQPATLASTACDELCRCHAGLWVACSSGKAAVVSSSRDITVCVAVQMVLVPRSVQLWLFENQFSSSSSRTHCRVYHQIALTVMSQVCVWLTINQLLGEYGNAMLHFL
jgi:hypothetical protein